MNGMLRGGPGTHRATVPEQPSPRRVENLRWTSADARPLHEPGNRSSVGLPQSPVVVTTAPNHAIGNTRRRCEDLKTPCGTRSASESARSGTAPGTSASRTPKPARRWRQPRRTSLAPCVRRTSVSRRSGLCDMTSSSTGVDGAFAHDRDADPGCRLALSTTPFLVCGRCAALATRAAGDGLLVGDAGALTRSCGGGTCKTGPGGPVSCLRSVEATIGFEPMNRGFADPRVRPLRHVAGVAARPPGDGSGSRLAAPRGFEPRLTDPKSAVLPLDEGAGVPEVESVLADPGEEWSGRRDSNPRPSPWQGDALPTEPLPLDADQVMVPRARFELATPRFSVACSTN